MLTWILIGSFFNLFYYFFKLDYFIAKITVRSIELINFNDLSEDDKIKFVNIKKICKNYDRNYHVFNIFIDLIFYPIYFIALVLSFIDYLVIRE